MEIKKIYIGSKFFRYIEKGNDETVLDCIRVLKVHEEKNEVVCKTSYGNKIKLSIDELIDNYKMLSSDGVMSASIVSLEKCSDIIISVTSLDQTKESPYAVCRQCIYDFFANNLVQNDRDVYVGVSVNRESCPANIDFNMITSCTDIKYNMFIKVYLDDSLEEILSFINTKKFDSVLRHSKYFLQNQFENKNIIGCCESVRDLLFSNNFMYDFRKCFNIKTIPFSQNNLDKLKAENIEFINKEYGINIKQSAVVPYSRSIDLSELQDKYFLCSTGEENYKKIYVVTYND